MRPATTIALITARGGSKGLPGKNIRTMAGKPMIAWSILAARAAKQVSHVIVSTDDPSIADVARASGAEVPFLRPPELATDTASHLDVIRHFIGWMETAKLSAEYLALLQPTSPLRRAADIDAAIELAIQARANAVVGVTPAKLHPRWLYTIGDTGVLQPYTKETGEYLQRQALQPVFGLNGAIYINRVSSLLADSTFLPPGTIAYQMPPEDSIDVDTETDFFLAEQLLKRRNELI